jgi:SET domain
VPLRGNLETATKLFQRFFEIREKHRGVGDGPFGELWVSFVENSEYSDTSRTLGAFRKTDDEWDNLHEGMTMKEIRIQEGLRTEEWLREHGTCADNFQEGQSTIRQAGRGAFATRRLVKDSVVAPLPLIHIGDAKILEMLAFSDIRALQTEGVRNGIQLILNYCFGHRKSSLLLCPYGPLTSLINHNQTQANVKLRWAPPSKGNHEPKLLETPIEFFARDRTAKLAMELVPLRDIQPGEEIFLDYGAYEFPFSSIIRYVWISPFIPVLMGEGDEWEAAWQEHVRIWQPLPEAQDYVPACELNSSPDRLRTEFEQMERPYPGNVNLVCNNKFFSSIDYAHFQQTGHIKVTDYHTAAWHPCEILRFRVVRGQLRYTAVVRVEEKKDEKLTDAPREAFKFVDRPYTSDMFLGNAFRHSMMIPDDMFPEIWMNL